WCHAPHESTVRPLLRVGGAELCLQCHGFEMESTPTIPEHEDLERNCLDCHHGHGGDDRYFLREAAESSESAEAEATDAETNEPADG
ncbi:MAG: cytochrome c3 family protein, partial [Phycisphaerales bacterium JB038]